MTKAQEIDWRNESAAASSTFSAEAALSAIATGPRAYFVLLPRRVELRLHWHVPTDRERRAFARAPLRAGCAVVDGCVFLLYEAQDGPHGDAPYLPLDFAPAPGQVFGGRPPARVPSHLTVRLIDEDAGRAVSVRDVTLPRRVNEALRRGLQAAARPRDLAAYVAAVNAIYRHLEPATLYAEGTWGVCHDLTLAPRT